MTCQQPATRIIPVTATEPREAASEPGETTTGPRWLNEKQQHAWRAYLRMEALLTAQLARQMQSDSALSISDFAVLVNLSEQPDGRLRALELARALRWEKSRLSHQISRMQQRGLVQRTDCPEDRRGAFVVITDSGRSAIEAAAPAHAETVHRLVFDALSDAQVAALTEISTAVVEQLEREDPGCD